MDVIFKIIYHIFTSDDGDDDDDNNSDQALGKQIYHSEVCYLVTWFRRYWAERDTRVR
jgi:hypothetical protein